MGLETWSNKQIASVIDRYRKRGQTEGGPFSLSELLLERLRRTKSEFTPVEVARKIVELASQAPDGQVTYKELWQAFRPGEEWVGNKSQQIMGNALARVVAYCIDHGLPILTVLVVQTTGRKLDPKAVTNICNDARELGIGTGPDQQAFIDDQRTKARVVVAAQLPNDAIPS